MFAQNNFQPGFLNKKTIKTLNIQDAEAQENIAKEIFTRRCGEIFTKSNNPNPTLNKKAIKERIVMRFNRSISRYRSIRQKFSYQQGCNPTAKSVYVNKSSVNLPLQEFIPDIVEITLGSGAFQIYCGWNNAMLYD